MVYRVVFTGRADADSRKAEQRVPLRRVVEAGGVAGVQRLLASTPPHMVQASAPLVQLVGAVARIGMAEVVRPLATGSQCLGCGAVCDGSYHVSNLMPYLHVPPPEGPFILDFAQACCKRGGKCEKACHAEGGKLAASIGMDQKIRSKL